MNTVNHVIIGLFPALGTANVFAILIGLLPVFQWWRVIPKNVIHKFMVRSYGWLVRDCCTSKKVMIRDELSALTAILDVGKGDDTLYIDIYAQGDRHPSELLSWIRNEINDINHDLNISAEEYIYIIYQLRLLKIRCFRTKVLYGYQILRSLNSVHSFTL